MIDEELAVLQRKYKAVQAKVSTLGFVIPGSVIERYTLCANPGCHCHGDPPTRHGPYLQYTRKLDGKTVTRRLTPQQAQDYREWIANRRALDELTTEMDRLSQQAADLMHNPDRR